MRPRFLILAAVVLPALCGCASSGGSVQVVAERVDLATLNCPQLQEGTRNWYLILAVEDEKLRNGTASQLRDVLPKAVTTYKHFEKAFVSRCPAEAREELQSLRRQFPIKSIPNM